MLITKFINRFRRINFFQGEKIELEHFHAVHKKAAFTAIKKAQTLNRIKLSPKLIKMSDDYAIHVFGSRDYAPWLYFYALIQGGFKEGWIPQNFYARYVLPDVGLYGISGIKTFSNIILQTEALPDIAYFIDGIIYNRNFSVITIPDLRKSIYDNNVHEVFLKSNNSLRGRGIVKLEVNQLNEAAFAQTGNCVIQLAIKQHEIFKEMITGSVATIRILTVKNPIGGIEYRAGHLKLSRAGDQWIKADNCVNVPIINKQGGLNLYGYTQDFHRLTEHPDSHFEFANKHILRFNESVNICTKLHTLIPHFPIIGWDVAIDHEENTKILEWNAGVPHPGIQISQSAIGPCFKGLEWEKLGGVRSDLYRKQNQTELR